MKCNIQYIKEVKLKKSEEDRLSDIHVNVQRQIKKSKAFRAFQGKYYTLKNDYAKGFNFLVELNKKYGKIISKLIQIPTGQFYVAVNVLSLENIRYTKEFYNNDFALKEQEEKWDGVNSEESELISSINTFTQDTSELFKSNPALAESVYDATAINRLKELHKLTNTPIGNPVSQSEGTGLCDGTCGIMAYRLMQQGMSYGTALIDDKYANYHAVALTVIGGKKFILNQPQLEFMSRKYQKAPVWERAEYWNADNVRMNRHLAELNQFIYGMEIPLFNFFTGKSFESEYGEISPVFKDITKTEKIEDIKNPGSGKIEKRTIIYQTAKLISNPKVSVKWSYDKEFPYEEGLTDFSSSLEGEEIIAWTNNVMTPRLIEATEENLKKEYKLTTKQAKDSIAKINSALIKPGSESNKTMTPEQENEAGKIYSEYVTKTGKNDIAGFRAYLGHSVSTENAMISSINEVITKEEIDDNKINCKKT